MRALIVGMGGLGCAAAPILHAEGWKLTLVDFDRVEERNLGRQGLYGPRDIGHHKVEAALRSLPGTVAHPRTFLADDIDGHDVVLDCTDDVATRAYIHHACLQRGVPLAWAAVDRGDGQAVFIPRGGPCLECLWPQWGAGRPCDDETDADVLRLTGSFQAGLAIRGGPGGILHLLPGIEEVRFEQRPDCQCVRQ